MIIDILLFLSLGMIAGLLSGLLGIGSGVVIVPGLFWILSRDGVVPAASVMHVAAATSLAVIAFTSLRALRSHSRRGLAIWQIYRLWMPGVCVGVIVGALIGHRLHSNTLSLIFSAITLLMAIKTACFVAEPGARRLPGMLGCSAYSALVGLKSGLLGLGGGALSSPFLIHYGVPVRRAFAVATAVSVNVSLVGVCVMMMTGLHVVGLPPWTTGYVYWPACALVAIGGVLCVPLGVRLSLRVPSAVLRYSFAVLLLAVSLRTVFHVLSTGVV